MRILERTKEIRLDGCCVAIGKFEGMHRGHQALLQCMGKQNNLRRVIFTFDRNPGSVLHGQIRFLFTRQERMMLARKWADVWIEYPFDAGTRQMEPRRFVEQILAEKLHARVVVVGADFHFGYGRRGTPETLRAFESEFGYKTVVVPQEQYDGKPVSSTEIRRMLAQGRIPEANGMLGFPFFLEGTVVHGNRLGRTIGFPTANLLPPEEKFLPPNGVYFSRTLLDGGSFYGITNIGRKPTIKADNPLSAETFLFDFDRDIYGSRIRVELLEHIRPEEDYGSLEGLQRQLREDRSTGAALMDKIKLDKRNKI